MIFTHGRNLKCGIFLNMAGVGDFERILCLCVVVCVINSFNELHLSKVVLRPDYSFQKNFFFFFFFWGGGGFHTQKK